ncbi:phage portal protein [Cedecea sp. P7760]|jgi:PBSX family phage portal protein|uniref:phage portal protein n=1 Tax=Cedecea sp. P7760 TaxID=2726983 RepID=UPI0015A4C344|nr:phage portal protein [Cedecea sp. P7760]NWC62940.1 phage portal protein [Cedecea sp. P7760]
MTKRRYNNKHTVSNGSSGQTDIADTLKGDPSLSAFTFDGPYSVTDAYDLLDSMCCVDNGRYYETPVDWKGFTRAFSQSPLHQSALYFKRNVLTGCFIPHPLLSRQAFSAFALDWFVFGNAYLERRTNRLGGPLKLQHVPALNTRRGSDLDTYWFIRQWKDEHEFKAGEVCHVMNPDIHQEIYGMPEYMAALLSASLSHSADKFRKLYYDNGSHAGCILYVGASQVDPESIKVVQKTLSEARGKGAFKNVLIHAPGGGKDGVQLLPFSQISAKDEFLNIKSATRSDLRDAHRIPPQLMGSMPEGTGSLGDIEKAARVFAINEMLPVMEAMKSVNDWLGMDVIRFNSYALLEDK